MKFRYANPNSRTAVIRRYVGYLGIFISWNLLGVLAWRLLRNMKKKAAPELEKLSYTDQNLSMMGYDSANLKRFKLAVSEMKVEGVEDDKPKTTEVEL